MGPPHLPVLCAAQAVCPELSSSEEDACVVSCNSDENCPQGTKCCPRSPCSRSCMVPLIGNTTAPTSQLRPVWGWEEPACSRVPPEGAPQTPLSDPPPQLPELHPGVSPLPCWRVGSGSQASSQHRPGPAL